VNGLRLDDAFSSNVSPFFLDLVNPRRLPSSSGYEKEILKNLLYLGYFVPVLCRYYEILNLNHNSPTANASFGVKIF
jgi:hypothetical protein